MVLPKGPVFYKLTSHEQLFALVFVLAALAEVEVRVKKR